MAKSADKLATALAELRELQQEGARVFASDQLTRTTRERLVHHGFLQEVMNGWLISSSPTTREGDTTPWFASFWEFCARYCDRRFGADWYLSPEQSLLLHGEHTAVPRQVIVHSPAGNNSPVALPFNTGLFVLRQAGVVGQELMVLPSGLRVFKIEAALARVPATFFIDHPIEAQLVLDRIRDPSALLARLLEGGHTVVAGRLAGAFRRLGHAAIADEIVKTMRAADHAVREQIPFEETHAFAAPVRSASAIAARVRLLWAASRDSVIAELPKPPERIDDGTYLRRIDEVYELDAYHSLSIEGYQVTPELIHRVAAGSWEPDGNEMDSAALAARGYWQAFRSLREVVRDLRGGAVYRTVLRRAHRDWYRALFAPHVGVGLLTAASLAGYRTAPVYLRGSRHVPPRFEVVGEAMHALFDLVESEPDAAVRAVLGHWMIGYVHPFPDGNGRVARFVMNALLAEAGYPWTVIRVDDRAAYLGALERASVEDDVRPFARFVAGQTKLGKKPSSRPNRKRKVSSPKSRAARPRPR